MLRDMYVLHKNNILYDFYDHWLVYLYLLFPALDKAAHFILSVIVIFLLKVHMIEIKIRRVTFFGSQIDIMEVGLSFIPEMQEEVQQQQKHKK